MKINIERLHRVYFEDHHLRGNGKTTLALVMLAQNIQYGNLIDIICLVNSARSDRYLVEMMRYIFPDYGIKFKRHNLIIYFNGLQKREISLRFVLYDSKIRDGLLGCRYSLIYDLRDDIIGAQFVQDYDWVTREWVA